MVAAAITGRGHAHVLLIAGMRSLFFSATTTMTFFTTTTMPMTYFTSTIPLLTSSNSSSSNLQDVAAVLKAFLPAIVAATNKPLSRTEL